MFLDNKFGDLGVCVVIEEFLDGEEFFFFVFVNGDKFYIMLIVQDYKCVYDGDKGLNIGGMGVYVLVFYLFQSVVDIVVEIIVKFVFEGMIVEGCFYLGVFYVGFILMVDGFKVIEFNLCFGDFEIQIIFFCLIFDFVQNIDDIMMGIEFYIIWQKDGVILGVVVVLEGYLFDYEKGVLLFEKIDGDIIIYYVGVKFVENSKVLFLNGGCVYMFVIIEDSVKVGQDKIYI